MTTDRHGKKPAVVVPARLGSQRVKAKSLRMLAGKPLIEWILDALKGTEYLNDITINSDSDLFADVAERTGVKFYKRKPELATSTAMIDHYIFDFIKTENPAYIAIVNPTSPFIGSATLDAAWLKFASGNASTQLCCEAVQTHCFYKGAAVNFSTDGEHPRSQDLEPILALNFAITIWDAARFVEQFERVGHGVYTKPISFFVTDGLANIDIDHEDDFKFAEFVAGQLASNDDALPAYDPVIHALIEKNINFQN